MNKTDVLIISDIHLGHASCNAGTLLEFLTNSSFGTLIILGDLFEIGGTISDEQFKILEYLRQMRDKIVYIDGNHDPRHEVLVKEIIGVKPIRKYIWDMGGKRFCAMHGHQFDKFCFIFSLSLIDKLFSKLISFLKMIHFERFSLKRWIDYYHNKFSDHIAKKAIRYAKRRGFDVMICGHTHVPLELTYRRRKRVIQYFNSGCLVENQCSYITIDKDGNVKLHSMTPNEKIAQNVS